MTPEYAEKLLEILVENSMRILRAGYGIDNVKLTFFEIIHLLRSIPELKIPFLRMAKITLESDEPWMLNSGMAPKELIELTAHELRWSEIKFLSEERVRVRFNGDSESARGDIAESVIKAFDDDWEDRDFYK